MTDYQTQTDHGTKIQDQAQTQDQDQIQDKIKDQIKKFIEGYEAPVLNKDMQSILMNYPDRKHIERQTDESKEIIQRFENLLVLRTFKRLKLLEKCSLEYKAETDGYNKHKKMYISY